MKSPSVLLFAWCPFPKKKDRRPGSLHRAVADRQAHAFSAMGAVVWRGPRQWPHRPSSGLQFVDRTPRLIDCLVRVGVPSRIGVGNGDTAAASAGDFIGLGPFSFRVEYGGRA